MAHSVITSPDRFRPPPSGACGEAGLEKILWSPKDPDSLQLPPDHPKRIANTPKSPEEEMKAKMPVFLDAMLRVSLVDVYETLRKVVHRVLADESVDMDARRRRAAALKLFADALHAASSEVSSDIATDVEPEKRFEHAMNVTMAAAMGQEMSEGHGDAIPPAV